MITRKSVKANFIFFLFVLGINCTSLIAQESYIATSTGSGYFPLVSQSGPASIFIDENDFKGVHRVAEDLQKDIERVTGKLPELRNSAEVTSGTSVIVGTLGRSSLIDQLVQNNKIDVSEIDGKWETFTIQVVENPFPNVEQALVIVGSDKRDYFRDV